MEPKENFDTREDERIRDLYFENYRMMWQFAYSVLRNQTMAEEAVQDTFLTALRSRDKLADSPNPVGWLINTLKNKIKRINRDRQDAVRRYVQMEKVPHSGVDTEDGYAEVETVLTVESIRDGQLVKEFYYEQRSIREIAERHGLTEGACKMRLKRAREELRKYFL